MKKLLTLFLLMLTAMGASAQITSLDELSTEKTYTLRNAFFNAYAVYNAAKSTTTVWAAGMNKGNISDESYKAKVDPASPNTAWMIVNFANKWYAYNMAAGKFLTVGYNPTTAATAQAKLDSTPRALEIKQKNGGFTLRTYTDGSQNFLCAAPQLPYPISIWTDSDNGATWEIAENPEVPADYDACIKKLEAAIDTTLVQTLEDFSPNKTYTIRNPYFNAYAIYNAQKSASTVWAAGMNKGNIKDASYKAKLDQTDPSSAWMVVQYNEKWYAYNMGARKLLTVGNNASNANTAPAKFDDTAQPLELKAQGDGTFSLRTVQGNMNYMCAAPQLAYPISVWEPGDGTSWEFKVNDDVEADYDACIEKIKAGVPVGFDVNLSNGFAWAGNSVSRQQLPHEIARGKAYTFYVRASEGWICPDGLTIDNDEERFTVSGIKAGKTVTAITIPAEKATGNIMVTGTWQRDEANPKAQQLVFDDDFDVDGEPDETKWVRTVREGATWNRFCSNSDKVVFNKDGYLHCRALKNPKVTSEDPGEMITGGIKSLGKHDFLYGRIEARIKTNLHTGTFPAFWLMPTNNIGGWPHGGEIDIWEVINNEDRAYGTVHNSWACCTTGRPNGSNLSGINYDDWHVMTVDWDENQIDWYVDGKYMWTYSKSNVPHGADATTNGWPYDKPFYIIMNQSVGNGGWAARPDVNFTYETLFDWVRVYQIPSTPDGIGQTPAATSPMSNRIYDLSGRPVSGNPTKGVYIQGNRKVVK